MIVRIRLRRGPRLKTKQGHCPRRRAARQLSNWFTQAAFFGYVMTVWKYGVDLGRVREFAFADGPLAHWQTWGLASLAAHAAGVPLRRFGESAAPEAHPQKSRAPLFVVPPAGDRRAAVPAVRVLRAS